MTGLQQYALRLIVGVMICGVLLSLVKDKGYCALLRFLSGIFLMISLLTPAPGISGTPDSGLFQEIIEEGEALAASGTALARQEKVDIITENIRAYILDKASEEPPNLEIEVTLGEDDLPMQVKIDGMISASEKQKLSQLLEKELGIAKENQLWTG